MLGPGSGGLWDRDHSSARNINRPERALKGQLVWTGSSPMTTRPIVSLKISRGSWDAVHEGVQRQSGADDSRDDCVAAY